MRHKSAVAFFLILSVFSKVATGEEISNVKVADGFRLQIFSDQVPNARTIATRADGVVFVTSAKDDRIYGLKDENGDGKADKFWVVAENVQKDHGIVPRGDDLYVAETNRILKISLGKDAKENSRKVLIDEKKLPGVTGHWWRSLAIGPDDRLYTEVGDSGNITLDNEDALRSKRQKIWSYKLDGSDEQLFATGLRNTQKMDWHPETKEMFGTDHGSDNIAPGNPAVNNDSPACEFNHIIKGKDYGHPYVVTDANGENFARPEYAGHAEIVQKMATSLPGFPLGGHVAPTGWIFYRGKTFPAAFHNAAIVCLHGSWNSTVKHGYRVEAVLFENGKPVKAETLVDFLSEDKSRVADRPVDAANYPDGSVLFTGDGGSKVYKLSADN